MKFEDFIGDCSEPLPTTPPTYRDILRHYVKIMGQCSKGHNKNAIATMTAKSVLTHFQSLDLYSSLQGQGPITKKTMKCLEFLKKTHRRKDVIEEYLDGEFTIGMLREKAVESSSSTNACETEVDIVEDVDPLQRFRDQLRDVTPTTAAIDSIEESITVEDGTHTNETATVEVDMNLDFLLKDLSISNTEGKEWVPNDEERKLLEVHRMVPDLVPVLLRRGVSCATAVDIFRSIHSSIVEKNSPLTSSHRLVTETEMRTIVNRVRKERISQLGQLKFSGLCFDGKESETLVYLNGKNQKVKQETYTLLAYPGEHSLGFVSLDDKSGRGVAATLINYLESKMIDYTRIRVLGSDGTNTLTGYNDGAVRHLQDMIGKPCFPSICMLHAIELPLRGLFCFLDDSKEGKAQFGGRLGKALQEDLSARPVGRFERIPCPDFPTLPESLWKKLSQDNKILYRLCIACIEGYVPDDLASAHLGPMNHARWLTLASRHLRYYVSNPTVRREEVATIAKYIVTVYYRMHALIKLSPRIEHGATNFLKFLELNDAAELTSKERKVVKKKIYNNSYFGHPEAIIIAALGHEDRGIRERGVTMCKSLLAAEQRGMNLPYRANGRPRIFCKPEINPGARNFMELPVYNIDLAEDDPDRRTRGFKPYNQFGLCYRTNCKDLPWVAVTMPFIVRDEGSTDPSQFDKFLDKKLTTSFPCHQQAVERAVALMTDAKLRVADEQLKAAHHVVVSEERLKNPSSKKRKLFKR
ncbi:hypothetical protein ACHWQZ_G015204 [Mnemiopsis leidyi]